MKKLWEMRSFKGLGVVCLFGGIALLAVVAAKMIGVLPAQTVTQTDVLAPYTVEYIDLVADGHYVPAALIAVTLRQPSKCRLTITETDGTTSVGWDSSVVASKFLFPAGKNTAWISRGKPAWIKSVNLEIWSAVTPQPIERF